APRRVPHGGSRAAQRRFPRGLRSVKTGKTERSGFMKFRFAPAVFAAALLLCFTSAKAQTTSPPQPLPQQTTPQPQRPTDKVIFSRSMDENGETTTQAGPGSTPQMVAAPIATDSERQTVTFTAFDLDVHLRPE